MIALLTGTSEEPLRDKFIIETSQNEFESRIDEALESLLGDDVFLEILESKVLPNHDRITIRATDQKSFADRRFGIIGINLKEVDSICYRDESGKSVEFSLERVIAHEVMHLYTSIYNSPNSEEFRYDLNLALAWTPPDLEAISKFVSEHQVRVPEDADVVAFLSAFLEDDGSLAGNNPALVEALEEEFVVDLVDEISEPVVGPNRSDYFNAHHCNTR